MEAMARVTGQPIWHQGDAVFERRHQRPGSGRKAAWALRVGRTARWGGHIPGCPAGQVARVWDYSCRHRRCPPWSWRQSERWLATQQARLLAGDHDPMLVTRPEARRGLGRVHVQAMTAIVFGTVRETLDALRGDAQDLGARPGIIATRHTGSQTLV
jgi:Transposase zinc-binding domain